MALDVTLKAHLAHGSYSMSMIYWDQPEGSIGIGVCDVCSHLEAYCEHRKNSWNAEETKLTCDLCGSDGT